ncbi:hypothetical protein KGQ20_25715 [Catenulispora sp. NF23]|uniref:Uncharacterized protein n=1 Tax=Catenulispora pinistramenti TaxID=2705254 RepID=A0ABS5L1R7_9ACTN|nr:hypothetical protein [Catenulispora pinistramenti]MBS2536166.1 hypothetical protein [Catenulispora pinistramenti]MBS2552090.1 hypothetical protein [Catenulispora pinistramenti]
MDSTPPGENRDYAVGRGLAAGGTDPGPLPPDPADQAVDEAEQIVCDAWVQLLVADRDQAHAAMLAAAAHCEAARSSLARILVGRAPNPIAVAHAALEEALAAGRQAARSYQQAQEGLMLELDLIAWRNIQRRMLACVARNGEPAPQPAQIEQPRPRREQPVPLLARLSRRFLPWCLSIAVIFTLRC